jgi:RNA polymerase sigma factor (sigma-70 family)
MRDLTCESAARNEPTATANNAHMYDSIPGESQSPEGQRQTDPDPFLIPTRESLLSRLKETSADESWREFFETYWKLIYNNARRAGLSDNEAQDVVQETMIGLMNHIREFQVNRARGSFKTWLWHLTRSKIVDQFRRRQKDAAIEERLREDLEEKIQPAWENEWQLNVAEEAFRRVQKRENPRLVQAFATYVIQGKAASETAKLLEMNVAAVYLASMRVKRMIKKEALKIQEGQI